MRKILISVLIVLLVILAYFTIFQGLSIGSFKVLSVNGIIELNNDLTAQIENINKKIKIDLQTKEAELAQAFDGSNAGTETTGLLQAKETYYNLVNVSTDNQITKASTEETYTTEYLYLRIGRHAREEGVNMNLTFVSAGTSDSSMSNLEFSITGQYTAIINFVSALEDDSELAFRIDNFDLVPNGELLQATFDVSGIRIKVENTSETVSSGTANSSQTNNTQNENTNTETTQETTQNTTNTNTVQ